MRKIIFLNEAYDTDEFGIVNEMDYGRRSIEKNAVRGRDRKVGMDYARPDHIQPSTNKSKETELNRRINSTAMSEEEAIRLRREWSNDPTQGGAQNTAAPGRQPSGTTQNTAAPRWWQRGTSQKRVAPGQDVRSKAQAAAARARQAAAARAAAQYKAAPGQQPSGNVQNTVAPGQDVHSEV